MTAETTATPEATPVSFRAETKQLLHILAHSLYTDREIFLRELLSNASDALTRIQFEMLTNQDVLDPEAELAIHITVDKDAGTITISDTGIGMTAEEQIENLGTIAKSGARDLIQRLEASQRGSIIGQFGVGFYSAFVVADEVAVVSRSFRPEAQASEWRSQGEDTFTLHPTERAERGTSIILKLKEDAKEFAEDWRIKQIIKKHSDYISFPIYVGEEQANQRTAIWRKAPREVKQEDYEEFYRQSTMDFSAPLHQLHLATEAPVDIHAILFVPSTRERGLIERRVEGKIKLYSHNVLIQEEAKDLLPNYYRFIEGVVDSEDLPLNVARETVQSTQVPGKIKKTLTGRLTKELVDLAEKNPETYKKFWDEFGAFIKEGIATDYAARTDLLPLLRFYSSKEPEKLVSLAEYAGRMIDSQTDIYYVLATDIESARRSPHLEALEERGIEALLMVDLVDGFMLSGLRDYEGHALKNADDPDLKLPGEAAAQDVELSDEAFARVVSKAKEVLGERVTGVRASNLLRTSAARLVAPEGSPNHEMERVQRMLDRDYKTPARLLELNRSSQLVADLATLIERQPEAEITSILIEQIYDDALLLEGLHPNPANMVDRIAKLMQAAASAAAKGA
ncbi:molecular chaperone HtpG [Chloroflexia bacterium SDU3-3]|nr:molecular chaperone HtpG [Chloroflexia bacterium SDU3-3]